MRYRIAVSHLDRAWTGGRGHHMRPAHLKCIEVIHFGLPGETTRQNKRRRHPVAGKCFETRRDAAVCEINPRTAEQRIELIGSAAENTAPSIAKQQPTALVGSWCGERFALGSPLTACGSEKVEPFG